MHVYDLGCPTAHIPHRDECCWVLQVRFCWLFSLEAIHVLLRQPRSTCVSLSFFSQTLPAQPTPSADCPALAARDCKSCGVNCSSRRGKYFLAAEEPVPGQCHGCCVYFEYQVPLTAGFGIFGVQRLTGHPSGGSLGGETPALIP